MLTTIHIAVRDRVPTITEGEEVISFNSDYVAEFDFDEEWESTVKTVYFVCEDGSNQPVVMSGNSCDVPMMAGEHRRIFVGVQEGTSVKPGKLKTTRPCCLKVKDSIADYLGEQIPDPSPSVYEQIMELLENLTTPTWDAVQNKPFSTLGDGLSVDEDGVLSAEGGTGGSPNAVQYVEQELTDEQKKQARKNITAQRNNVVQYWLKANGKSSLRDILSRGENMAIVTLSGGVMDNTMPAGMYAPVLVLFGTIAYGKISAVAYDGLGDIWKGSINMSNYETNMSKVENVKIDETLTESGSAADAKAVGDALAEKADTTDIPNVPAWAMADEKPTYTAAEVHALPDTTVIPPAYTLPQATADALGGIKADAATAEDTQDVRIGTDGKLRTKPGSGGTVTDGQVNTAVSAWLTEHPEATTTVADGSIATAKIADGAVDAYKMADTIVYEQIFDKNEWDENGVSKAYINAQNGKEVSANTNYKATHYIPCREKTLYTHNLYLRVEGAVCYDKDKQFVGTAAITNDQFTTLPGTSYIRFSTSSGSQPQNMMICMGDTLYSEYFVGIRYCITNLDYSKTGINNSLSGDKLKDNTVGGVKLQDESVSRTKIGTIPPDKIEGIEFVNLFAAEEYQSDIASGTDTDKVLRGWLGSNGAIHTESAQYTTILIPCKPNTEYSLYYMVGDTPTVWSFQGRVGFRDANKKIFGTFVPDSVTFTTPEGAYEIVCTTPSVLTPYADCQKLMLVYGSETPAYEVHKTTPSWLQTNAQLTGVSVLCYGDSLTQGKYPSKVAELLGVTVVDAGVGGNTVAQMYDRVGNYGTTYDVVTLMVGTNDNGGQTSCPLGTVDDEAATDDNATSTDTSYAARLKRLLYKIKITHRGAVYVIMPPFQHAWGATTFESVATLMGEIAKQYKMPYLDIYHLCGWSGLDAEDKALFMSDITHENDLGAQRIAELLAGFIKQLKGA